MLHFLKSQRKYQYFGLFTFTIKAIISIMSRKTTQRTGFSTTYVVYIKLQGRLVNRIIFSVSIVLYRLLAGPRTAFLTSSVPMYHDEYYSKFVEEVLK